MITKEFLKTELDKVNDEYLEALYKVIKAFESNALIEDANRTKPKEVTDDNMDMDWHDFIQLTYGCLANDPIERGDQGNYEIREVID